MLTEHVRVTKPGHRLKVVLALRKLRGDPQSVSG
jgi:hypothetical protein